MYIVPFCFLSQMEDNLLKSVEKVSISVRISDQGGESNAISGELDRQMGDNK